MSAVYGYRASSWDQRAGGFLYLRQCLYRDLRNCPNGGDHRAWQIPKRCAIARLSMTRQSHAHCLRNQLQDMDIAFPLLCDFKIDLGTPAVEAPWIPDGQTV